MKKFYLTGTIFILLSLTASPVSAECTDDVIYEFKHWLTAFPCIDDGVFGCYLYVPRAYGIQDELFYIKSNPTFYPREMSFSYEDIASGEIEIKNACIYKNGRRMFCGDENYMHHMYQWFRRIFNARKSDCFQEADGSVDALLSRTNNLKDTNVVGQNRNE